MVSREQLGSDLRTVTGQVIRDPNLFRQFPLTQLQQIDPRFAGSTSFIPPDVQNQLAGSFQYQRAPGTQFANYPMAAPNFGGQLMAATMPSGFVGSSFELPPLPPSPPHLSTGARHRVQAARLGRRCVVRRGPRALLE